MFECESPRRCSLRYVCKSKALDFVPRRANYRKFADNCQLAIAEGFLSVVGLHPAHDRKGGVSAIAVVLSPYAHGCKILSLALTRRLFKL